VTKLSRERDLDLEELDRRSQKETVRDREKFDREQSSSEERLLNKQPRRETNFTDYVPRPNLYDPYFGGFKPYQEDDSTDGVERICRRRPPAAYFMPEARARRLDLLGSYSGRGPKGWANDQPSSPPPFDQYLLRAIEQNERGRPIPDDLELGRYYSNAPRRGSNDPTGLWSGRSSGAAEQEPSASQHRAQISVRVLADLACDRDVGAFLTPNRDDDDIKAEFARAVLRKERERFYAWRGRAQRFACRSFKPSRKIEFKRFPKLKKIESNPLLTWNYLARGLRQVKDDQRAMAVFLVEQFIADGGQVRKCPAEKLASQVVVRADGTIVEKPPAKIGRPPIGAHKMTDAERKQRQRAKAAKSKRRAKTKLRAGRPNRRQSATSLTPPQS